MSEDARTFVAVLISDDLKRRMALVQEEFKKVAPKVKWVAAENFHVTVKFLGDVSVESIRTITDALADAVRELGPFDLEIGGAGAFPSPKKARTVWIATTAGSRELAEIARRAEDALAKLGFPKEDRPFRSHVTIGRVKDDRDAGGLAAAFGQVKAGDLGAVRVTSIAFMKSELRREGPIYSVLAEIPLEGSDGRHGDRPLHSSSEEGAITDG